jgi:hypothetical protein
MKIMYLQLHMQSAPITTKVVSLNPVHGEVSSIQHCDRACQWLTTGWWFSPGTPVKTDRHNIIESGIKHHKPTYNLGDRDISLHFVLYKMKKVKLRPIDYSYM